ncbi:MAG: ankyrin repeat domain-containing protein [Thermofilum sp.]|nr:ankyrin repeat domain-containing protein [Thermofilum sp.]
MGLNEELLKAAADGDAAKVKELLEKGADANARDRDGLTPLHYAAKHGHVNVVKLLIEKGVYVNIRSEARERVFMSYHTIKETSRPLLVVWAGECDALFFTEGGLTPLKEINRSIPLRINVCLSEPAQRPPSTADLIIRAGCYQAKRHIELKLAGAFNYSPLIPGTLLGDPRRLDKGNYTLKLYSEDVSFSSDDALPLLMKSFQWLFWPIDFSSNGCYVKRGSVIGTYTPKPGEEYYLVAKEDISFRRGLQRYLSWFP